MPPPEFSIRRVAPVERDESAALDAPGDADYFRAGSFVRTADGGTRGLFRVCTSRETVRPFTSLGPVGGTFPSARRLATQISCCSSAVAFLSNLP